MSTTAPPKRSGLPRAVVAVCVLIGVFVGAYAVLMLLSVATASTEHRTRTFTAAATLRVDTGSGDVSIVAERRRIIRVEMEIHRGMWRGAWQPEVELQAAGRGLRLGSECSLWANIGVNECGADFTIYVPRGTRVAVDASSGDVRVQDLAAPATIDSSSGDVHAERLRASLRVSAASGDVHVEGFRGAPVEARASSGDVDLVASRAPRRLVADASSGDISIEVPDVPWRVRVETDSGDENVQVRQDPGARRSIDANADSGDVSIVRLGDG